MLTNLPVHPLYSLNADDIQLVRDCVDGSTAVKRKAETYLAHPSDVDTTSDSAKKRYIKYLQGAEFDEYPAQTLQTLMGKLRFDDTAIELPDGIAILQQDVDGDGMSLLQALELSASNVTQVKFQVLVAEFSGLGALDPSQLSLADIQQLNPRPTVKQYTRENVVNWNSRRINGVMQLSFIALLERSQEFNQETYKHTDVYSYLILALDDDGNYYQKKIVYSSAGKQESEPSYVTVAGQPLKWLPVVVVSDEPVPAGMLPFKMGFLYRICAATLAKYRVSADYKETQRKLIPTIFSNGGQPGDADLFEQLNGRKYIELGGVNVLPNTQQATVLSANASMDDYHWYFAEQDRKIRQMGGSTPTSGSAMTATEADIQASEQNAMLQSLATNLENGWRRVLSYCAMFAGLWLPDAVEDNLDQIVLSMPRDFATPKLSVEEVRVLFEAMDRGAKTRDQVVFMLEQGGWDYQTAEETLAQLEEFSSLGLPPVSPERQQLDDTGEQD